MNSQNLIIFDIDGTLTQTVNVDSEIFARAFLKHLSDIPINPDWDDYRYSTDSELALEIFERHIGREPTNQEISTIKNTFHAALENLFHQNAKACLPMPGAQTIFSDIEKLGYWDIAIATGCWRDSALIKLNYGGIVHHDRPLANADDHLERTSIILTAVERAKAHYQRQAYQEVIYVGDRMWDHNATAALKIGFVGVGHELADKQLANMIAHIDNYQDMQLTSLLREHSVAVATS